MKLRIEGYSSVDEYLDAHFIAKAKIFGNMYSTEKACRIASIVRYKNCILSYYKEKGMVFIDGRQSLQIG
jgi:hypothetical protein